MSKSNSDSKYFLVVGTMRIDRYYSALKEKTSPITVDAKSLLEKQNILDFSIPMEQIMYTVPAVYKRSLPPSILIHKVEIWHKSFLPELRSKLGLLLLMKEFSTSKILVLLNKVWKSKS